MTANERRVAATHLLKLGKTQAEAAKAVGMTQTAIMRLHSALRLRGEVESKKRATGRTSKRLKPLSKEVRDLSESTLDNLASAPDERRQELAEYVKQEGLTERETRAVVKAVNERPNIDLREVRRQAVQRRSEGRARGGRVRVRWGRCPSMQEPLGSPQGTDRRRPVVW